MGKNNRCLNKIKVLCAECNKTVDVFPYRLKSTVFCSKYCANIGLSKKMKGVKRTPESVKKTAEANRGKKRTLEQKERMSKAQIGKTGEKASNWQGGKTAEQFIIRCSREYKLWREAVFKRDNYRCSWCGDNGGGNLNADHIKPFCDYPELRLAIDNGRTLCEDCHKKTDTFGGKNREKFRKNGRFCKKFDFMSDDYQTSIPNRYEEGRVEGLY